MKRILLLSAVALLVLPSVGCRGRLMQRLQSFRLFRPAVGAPCSSCQSPTISGNIMQPAPAPSCSTGTCNNISMGYPSGSCSNGTCNNPSMGFPSESVSAPLTHIDSGYGGVPVESGFPVESAHGMDFGTQPIQGIPIESYSNPYAPSNGVLPPAPGPVISN